MNNFDLLSFSADLPLSQAAATAWLKDISSAGDPGKPYCVALSGGHITLKFFAAAIALSKTDAVSLAGVHFFWADERCVPPNHPESNFAAARQHFFQPLRIETDKIHRIQGELSPDVAANVAAAEIQRWVPSVGGNPPVLDLIFLGLGEDGHVASLFPGEAETTISNPASYRAVRNSPKPPPERVTLGYGTIAAARQVWVLASGPGKTTALRDSIAPAGQTPLARVLQSRRSARIFTDISLEPLTD